MTQIVECADRLVDAQQRRVAIPRLTLDFADLSLDDAYLIQDEVVARRIASGDRLVGAKLGLTARAKQVQMQVAEPVYGQLLSSGLHHSNDPIVVSEFIHPRAEPEIVFFLGTELRGPGVSSLDVLMATRAVCCGLEIIDSRYADFSFSAADVVADNTSAARFVLGPKIVAPGGLDLSLIGVTLAVNGELVATAAGGATMGHPAEAVAMLVNWLGERNASLPAGSMVFSGALTAAVPLTSGTVVTASFGRLGPVTVRGI
jgi:2-oxo-3-hexenedioate decarboxylase